MRIIYKSFLLIFLLFIIAACAENQSDISSGVLQNNLEKWQEMGIKDYRIEVMAVNSIWHAQKNSLTVMNGSPTDSDSVCFPAPMEVGTCIINSFDVHDFQVEGLFNKTKEMLESDGFVNTKIKYDPDFGFPVEISYDDPAVADDDWSWQVISFTQISDK